MINEPLLQIPANSQIFVLTGAGISKESGIQTFRDSDGLWNNHRIEDVASPEGFYRNPTLVYDFYNNRRKELNSGTEANKGHFDLYELEKTFKINIAHYLKEIIFFNHAKNIISRNRTEPYSYTK